MKSWLETTKEYGSPLFLAIEGESLKVACTNAPTVAHGFHYGFLLVEFVFLFLRLKEIMRVQVNGLLGAPSHRLLGFHGERCPSHRDLRPCYCVGTFASRLGLLCLFNLLGCLICLPASFVNSWSTLSLQHFSYNACIQPQIINVHIKMKPSTGIHGLSVAITASLIGIIFKYMVH